MPQISMTDPGTGIEFMLEITEEQQELIIQLLKKEPPQDRISVKRLTEIVQQAINERPNKLKKGK